MGVRELEKPRNTPCRHLCPSGCGVYQERPGSCAEFECLWLAGHVPGSAAYRPDVLGVIFTPNLDGPAGPFLEVHEVWDGAFGGEKFRYMLDKLVTKHGVLCALKRVGGKISFRGPEDRIRRLVEGAKAAYDRGEPVLVEG